MRVVLDTNVIVSAFLVALGAPALIGAAWRAGCFDLIVSPAILAEYTHTLGYPRLVRRHHFSSKRIDQEVEIFRKLGIMVEPDNVPAVIAEDPDDDHILAAAVTGHADYIVTRDPDLLTREQYRSIRILTPAAFARQLLPRDREHV